jgi:hypothetical protein
MHIGLFKKLLLFLKVNAVQPVENFSSRLETLPYAKPEHTKHQIKSICPLIIVFTVLQTLWSFTDANHETTDDTEGRANRESSSTRAL